MGKKFSKDAVKADFEVELFKWSSSQFPEEYALVYTSHFNECNTCTLRLSANRNKVLCTVSDNMCKCHPIKIVADFNVERDNNGDLKTGGIKVNWEGNYVEERNFSSFYKFLTFYCNGRGNGTGFFVLNNSSCSSNMVRPIWVVGHNIHRGANSTIYCEANIQCDKEKGLCVELQGPYKRKGLFLQEWARVQIDRKKVGEPSKPKASDAIVNCREFKEEEEENDVLFQGVERNNCEGSRLSAKGHLNNISAQIQGNYNGSIFSNCHFGTTH